MIGFHHEPVLLKEVVEALAPADGEIYVDCTVGGGGHTEALLSAARCTVIGLDRDPEALAAASARLAWAGERFRPIHGRFSALGELLDAQLPNIAGVLPRPGMLVHGILADLGVSSHQLDTAERGFSFRHPGPLDMRMDPTSGNPASVLVNTWDEASLAELIREFGEEKHARRVARQIVAQRPFHDTRSLADAIARAIPGSGGGRSGRIHPATRTFQALRIAVNDELGELDRLLPAALDRLEVGGRLALITFHSLEDRRVKRFLDEKAGKNRPKDPFGHPVGPVYLRLQRDVGGEEADSDNPRARSARLRSAVRLPWNAR